MSLDSNTWYSLMNDANDYYLNWQSDPNTGGTDIYAAGDSLAWQFWDPTDSGAYLVRSEGNSNFCLTLSDGSPSLAQCDPDSDIYWLVEDYSDDLGNSGITISNVAEGGYLEATDPEYPATVTAAGSLPSGDASVVSFLWGTESLSTIGDDSWSTVPWTTSTTDDSSVSTPPPTSDTTDDGYTVTSYQTVTATQDTYTPDMTTDYQTVTTTQDIASPTDSTPMVTTDITSTDESTPAVTSSNPQVTPGSTSVPPPNFDYSEVGRSLHDINPIIAALALPKDVNVICTNCSGSGYFDVDIGSDDSIDDFYEMGYVQMDFAGITINTTLEVDLEPGFTPLNTRISLYNKTLASKKIGDDLELAFVFEIGIPITVQLDTPVSFQSGLVYTLPSAATIVLDPNDPESSSATGFEASTVDVLPFSYNVDDLTFTILTGLQPRIYVNATTTPTSDISASGIIEIDLDIPRLNFTISALENVDSNCLQPSNGETTYKYAARVKSEVEGDVHAKGSIAVHFPVVPSKTWSTPEQPLISRTWDAPDQCLYGDRLNTGSTGAARRLSASWSMIALCVGTLVLAMRLLS